MDTYGRVPLQIWNPLKADIALPQECSQASYGEYL